MVRAMASDGSCSSSVSSATQRAGLYNLRSLTVLWPKVAGMACTWCQSLSELGSRVVGARIVETRACALDLIMDVWSVGKGTRSTSVPSKTRRTAPAHGDGVQATIPIVPLALAWKGHFADEGIRSEKEAGRRRKVTLLTRQCRAARPSI